MSSQVKPVRSGEHTITPHLVVNGAQKAIDFYREAFGAEVKGVHKTPDGKIMHAELRVGDSIIMLADEFPGMGSCSSPQTLGGTSVTLNLYQENVDELFKRAVGAGATVTMPLADMFWGDRYGQVTDPFGHSWALGQHIEEVSPEELERRSREAFSQMTKKAKAAKG
ncbi:MAG: VOC family protein [Acidobacteriia bacterium]|nr:VOC family protein [Terriglobia bacterium]